MTEQPDNPDPGDPELNSPESAGEPAPWAMQLVARVEKVEPPSGLEVAAAAVLAVIGLLDDERTQTEGAWADALDAWQQHGKIRKLVRRARATAWQRAQEPAGHTARHGRAEVRAYVPSPMDAVPPEVAKLQIRSTPLDAPEQPVDRRGLVIAVTPEVEMSWGKRAAQCAHAGQLLWRDSSPDERTAWIDLGRPVSIVLPDQQGFDELANSATADSATVTVRDGGFTEIPAGTLTAAAWWDLHPG